MTEADDELNKGQSNTQRAVAALREMIFSGALGAGSDHLETELAEQLGMSRTPVREAALTLAAQGLVTLRPRKGMRVRAVSADDMKDVYDVLTELESLAAECAAQQGYSPHDLTVLRQAIETMEAELTANNREAWAQADDVFHRELLRLGCNQKSVMIAAMMEDQVRRAKATTLYMRPSPDASNRDHRDVLDAIQRGDAAAARRIHHDHRRRARDMMVDLLNTHKLRHL